MRTQKLKHLIFLFLVCAFYNSFSQITVSPTVGCVPLTGVAFSGPAGAIGITWNFGDAVTSNLASPTHNYTSPGSFTVTYNATVSGNPVTYTAVVVVYGKPTASFNYTVPAIRCKPLNVPFTSTSSGPAAIASYTWNFGDGGQGSGPNPIWTYNLQGSFFITLLVTDVNGCTSNLSVQQGPVNVSTPPTVVISSNPLALTSCTAPFTAAFSGSNCVSGSPIAGPLAAYSWNFGNTQTSTQQTPGNITYNTPGVYNVSLTVTDNNNCSATAVKPVSVSQPTLQTTIPATVCLNAPFAFSFQTNQPTTVWNFGVASPTILATGAGPNTSSVFPGYSAPGVYTINISAGSFPCTAQQTKTVYVEQVVANFTHTPPSFTCSPTFTALYTNLSSTNAISYTWSATNYNGNSISTSTLTNPTFTLVQGSLNPYTIYNTWGSQVTLIAQSANGCLSTFTTNVFDSIRRPTAWFNKDKKEGCAPLVVKFRDSSFTAPVFPITSYTWNNGATPATIVTGNIPPTMINPTFTYSSPGTYTPYLIVQTATGCIDTSFVDTVHVVNPPTFNFAVTPSVVCWNQPVTVSITPTSTNPVQHWHVNSDNGFFSHCINNPNPSWNFTHVGVHTFTVEGYSHSCKGIGLTTQSVTVKGPIVQGRYETNCTAGTRKVVKFYSFLQDAASGTLNYGDGSPVANIVGNPGGNVSSVISHTYALSGNYTATLTGLNGPNGCAPHTYTMLVTVRDIQANFNLPSVGCTNVSQSFTATPSVDVHIGCMRGYVWYFDNLPPNDTTAAIVTHTFTTPGTHTVFLMVKDDNSCIDTTMHTMRISSANPTFSFSSNPICLSSGTVQMINTTPQVPDPVQNFIWDFGDGSPLLSTTSLTSPIHTYLSATSPFQIYTVTLTGINSQTCIDIVTHTIQVVNPVATIVPSNYIPCIPTSTANLATNTLSFTAPPAYTSYTFNYGDGSSSLITTNNVTPAHTFTTPGSYTATVIVDVGGCKNSGSVTVNVELYPIPDFTLNTGNVICRDSQVEFANTSTVTTGYTLNWDLSTGSPILPVSPVVWTYTASGQAVITLTITTNANQCKSVISKTLSILGASANLNLDKQVVCLGNAINFNMSNPNNVFMYTFDYGDGTTGSFTTSASPNNTVTHTYNYYPPPAGNTTVSLSYYPSSDPLKCPKTTTLAVQVVKIVGDFDRNNEITKKDSVHCIGIIDQFSNQTPNSAGFVFNWNFGDGFGTASTQNPVYTYTNSGVYTITLNITDPVNNCKGLAIKNMTINPLPVASVFSPDSVCQSAPFILNSTTLVGVPAFTYTWNPSVGLTSPNNFSTSATANNSSTYTLTLQDGNGCRNTTTKSVYIQLPPVGFQWDTAIVIGQLAYLNNNSGSNFTYTWSPPTGLNCVNCPNPTVNTLVNMVYTVTIADNLGCFRIQNTHTVEILPKSSVDVPTAFTPNGDGTNDIIYVDGWGIKKLNYFRIFNRWGQLLFESTDIKIGWDGTFNGVPQNMETYVYQVSAETYIDKDALLTTGTFKLIR